MIFDIINSMNILRGYQGEDIEIQLPGDLTMRDIDWLAVWCITFRENFGHVMIPKDLDVPPALGQNQLTVRFLVFFFKYYFSVCVLIYSF